MGLLFEFCFSPIRTCSTYAVWLFIYVWCFNLISSQLFMNMKTENHKSAVFQNRQTSESTFMYLAFNVNIGLNILFPLFKDLTWSGRDYISNNHVKTQRMQHKTLLSSIHREQVKPRLGGSCEYEFIRFFISNSRFCRQLSHLAIVKLLTSDRYAFKIYDDVFLIFT